MFLRYLTMKYCRIVILTIVMLSLLPKSARAQYDMVFSHYFDMPTSFNPAAAGKEGQLNVNLAYAMQLVGYEHNPKTMYVAGDLPLKAMGGTNGLGLTFFNDQLGLFQHQRISAQYAYNHKLGKKGNIAAGVQAGLLTEKYSSKGLDLEEANDPAFSTTDLDGNTLDVGVGLYLSFPKWYIGASAQHLTYPTVSLGEYNEIKIDATYFLTGGYEFQLPNPTLKIATSALVRSDLTAYRGDLTARVIYTHEDKMMYGGVGYSPTNSVTAYFGMKLQDFIIGYCYEAYTNGIGWQNGSHELRIGYKTELELGKKGKNYHQSVRYL